MARSQARDGWVDPHRTTEAIPGQLHDHGMTDPGISRRNHVDDLVTLNAEAKGTCDHCPNRPIDLELCAAIQPLTSDSFQTLRRLLIQRGRGNSPAATLRLIVARENVVICETDFSVRKCSPCMFVALSVYDDKDN